MSAPASFSTFIQSGKTGTAAGTVNTILSVTLPGTTLGSTILVFFYSQSSIVPTSASDGTNTYTNDYSNTNWSGLSNPLFAYSTSNATSGSLTVSVNFASDSSPKHMIVVEHRNLLASPFDQSVSTSGNTNTTPFGSGTTPTLAQSTELVVLLASTANGNSTATPKAPFIHNIREATAESSYALTYADTLVNTTSGQSGTVTWGTGGFVCAVGVLTYKFTNNRLVLSNNLRPHPFSPGVAR